MEKYSKEQRILIVKTYYQNGESFAETVRKLRASLGREDAPTVYTVRRLIHKFEETGSTIDNKKSGRPRSGRSEANVVAVSDSVAVSPGKSIRRRAQEMRLSSTTMQRILSKDLQLHPYKVQLTQELKPTDHGKRRQFVEWILEMQRENEGFTKRIIFSDEAHFHLNGFVNKQNCRIWGSENPRVIKEKQMHPQRVTVWCGIWSQGLIGPYFFEDGQGKAVTVNGVRYREMLTNFLWPRLDQMDIQNVWFQQDGATCHTSGETIALLHEKFPHRLISLRGDQSYPPRSCDLTPCDFFLWGYAKSRVYQNKPRNLVELKQEIQRVFGEINEEICGRVMVNFMDRIIACRASRGGICPILFFMFKSEPLLKGMMCYFSQF
jgi:Helix-turn-helix domain (DUF4817)